MENFGKKGMGVSIIYDVPKNVIPERLYEEGVLISVTLRNIPAQRFRKSLSDLIDIALHDLTMIMRVHGVPDAYADRYAEALMNGGQLPSTDHSEPARKQQ